MKRRTFTWSVTDTISGETVAMGERYAAKSSREAAEKALGDHCRGTFTTATRGDRLDGGYVWHGSDGRTYQLSVAERKAETAR